MKQALILIITIAFFVPLLQAQTIEIREITPGEVGIKAFHLNDEGTLEISGLAGKFSEGNRSIVYYGWILDAETREVVWHQFEELRGRSYRDWRAMDNFNYQIELPQGTYELHFTGANTGRWDHPTEWSMASLDHFIESIFDPHREERYMNRVMYDLYISVKGEMEEVENEELARIRQSDALIQFIGARDHDYFEEGFNIEEETNLIIYALGEGNRDETHDGFSIYDVVTRETIYQMEFGNTTFAGGDEKNLLMKDEISLSKGSYKIIYQTDDSHSTEKWNALPPDDPSFYGVTLYPSSGSDRNNMAEYNPPKNAVPVVDLTRVRNNEIASTGFTVKEDTRIRLTAVGEGKNGEMYDYGWIIDAKTLETIWEMDEYRTDHAGGAYKNRISSEEFNIKKGDYIAYFVTDASHAYNKWNSSAPLEKELWGLSIRVVDERDHDNIETFNPTEYEPENTIASILKVRDHEYIRKSFSLNEETRIRVIALGEGSGGDMYDKGWIRNMDTGKIAWEMKFRKTQHGGGAVKNRMANDVITLPAGEYKLFYESDGSHSYSNWNSEPPYHPEGYGIRVLVD